MKMRVAVKILRRYTPRGSADGSTLSRVNRAMRRDRKKWKRSRSRGGR